MKDYEFAEGKTGRTVFVRVKAGADLVKCVKEAFEKSGFTVASVSIAIGSLRKIRFVFVNEDGRYTSPVEKEGMFELISAGGFLSRVSGKIETHIHFAFADNEGKVFGGHMLEEGNIVYATAEIRIDEIEGVEIAKSFDRETNFTMFKVRPKKTANKSFWKFCTFSL